MIQTRDYRTDKYKTYIPKTLARKFCVATDIMIGRYGPPIFQIFRGLEGAYNVALVKAIPHEEIIHKDYLFYFISQYEIWAFVENLSQRSGGQTGVDLDKLKKYPFPLPPLPEQQKIASILSTVDEKLENIDAQISKTQELKKGLMQQLLTKGIGHTKFKSSELGDIPDSWEVVVLSNYAVSFAGGTPLRSKKEYYENGTIPWVKSGEVNQMNILKTREHITEEAINDSSAKLIKVNSVLVALYGATAGNVGMLRIEAASNQAVLAISAKTDDIVNNFIYHYLKLVTRKLMSLTQGSGQPNLSKGIIDSLKIPLPKKSEQQKIATILSTVDEKITSLQTKKQTYQQLKKGLMQQLLTGRIRVQTSQTEPSLA